MSLTKVSIVGASGFIGKNLIQKLKSEPDLEIRGLARSFSPDKVGNVEYVPCDLFSLLEIEKALEGQDIGIYLVHSMLPSSRLAQGNFQDYDLILADNFVRAAKKAKLKKIIYLGGIIPATKPGEKSKLSEHLKSRFEVEECLRSSNIPVVSLRAGIITGAGGSSFTMIVRLVQRLPFMICPAWTQTRSSPIHVDDVVASILYSIRHFDSGSLHHAIFDIGGPEETTYLAIMQQTARLLEKRRYFVDVQLFSPRFSKLWVKTFTGAPKQLVYPLIDSLLHEMKVTPSQALILPDHHYKSFLCDLASEAHLQEKRPTEPTAYEAHKKWGSDIVQSVQRVPLPKGKTAEWMSNEYPKWLTNFFRPFIHVKSIGNDLHFNLFSFLPPLLILQKSPERSSTDRVLFYIRGGILVANKDKGRLEFRESFSKKNVIIAIHGFQPRLPWFIYRYSQALIHLWTMKRFGKYLESLPD